MQNLNRRAKSSSVLLLAGMAIGWFLVGTSSSQEARRGNEAAEVGRYQYVNAGMIFDTKTARVWRLNDDYQNQDRKWVREDAPWEWNQRPNLQSNDGRPSAPVVPVRP